MEIEPLELMDLVDDDHRVKIMNSLIKKYIQLREQVSRLRRKRQEAAKAITKVVMTNSNFAPVQHKKRGEGCSALLNEIFIKHNVHSSLFHQHQTLKKELI